MWVITPLLFVSFCIFIFPFGHFSWLGGAKVVNANLAGLAFSSLLLGTVRALWPHCKRPTSRRKRILFLSLPLELLPNSLWKASLWDLSAFCLSLSNFLLFCKGFLEPTFLSGFVLHGFVWTQPSPLQAFPRVTEDFTLERPPGHCSVNPPIFKLSLKITKTGVVWELPSAPLLLRSCVNLSPNNAKIKICVFSLLMA